MIWLANGDRVLYQWTRGAAVLFDTHCGVVRISREDDQRTHDIYPAQTGGIYRAVIPDRMLRESGYLRVSCILIDADGERVADTQRFIIRAAQRPTDYVHGSQETASWAALGMRMEALERAAREGRFDGKPGDDYKLTEEDKQEIKDAVLDDIGDLPSGGLTAEQISALDGMFRIASYTEDPTAAYSAFRVAFGLDSGEVEPDEPENPDVTLTSITVKYSGGDVDVGTALSDLTGIVVTATYSDGSTRAVSGYTLSGEIAEGVNIITVSYGGLTATFTVTGVAESVTYTVTNNLTNVTNSNAQIEVTEGFYSAALTVADGYMLESVVVTMGGVDVTADMYTAETGTILITEVTGNIVITATAVKLEEIATKQTGGTNVYAVAPDGTTIYTGGYTKAAISYRSTQSDATVSVTITNPTESDIKTSLYIGGIENGIGATIKLAKVSIVKAVCVANNVTIPAGQSVTYNGVVPAGYHMGIHCTNTSATIVCHGSLDVYEPVNEYELVKATPTNAWEQYSGNTADESALIITEAVKYMTEPFAEATKLRVTVYNSGESAVNISSASYQILFAIYGNGTDAVGFNVKRLSINDFSPSLDAGCEEFDAEFVVPAGYRFCTSVPTSCIYIKKVV